MILKDTISNSIPLVLDTSKRAIKLSPVVNSPLDYLNKESQWMTNFVDVSGERTVENDNYLNEESFWTQLAERIHLTTRDLDELTEAEPIDVSQLNKKKHSELLAYHTNHISKAILEHITFAKQVIAPQVSDLVERTNNDLANLSDREINRFSIEVRDLPDIFRNPALLSLIEPLGQIKNTITVDNYVGLPSLSLEEIIPYVRLDVPSLDEELKNYLLSDSGNALLTVWNKVFVAIENQPIEYNGYVSINELVDDAKDGLINALAIFTLASNLIDNPIEGTKVRLEQYNNHLSLLESFAGQQLYRKIEGFANQLKQNILVANYQDKTCIVNRPVYEEFLENGGSVEVLFGQMLANTRHYSLANIQSDTANSLQRWKDHEAIQKSIEYNNRLYRAQRILKENFELLLRDLGEVPNYSDLVNHFAKEVSKINVEDLDDIYKTVLTLINRVLYPGKGAARFLELMCSHEKMNPELDPREIATLASIDYIGAWISEMIKVE